MPFKGAADALTNTIGGSVQYSFNSVSSALPLLKSGRVIGLTVSTKERSAVLPDIPSIAEAGLPGFEFGAWFGMVVPSKVAVGIRYQLSKESARILRLPKVKERLLTLGAGPIPTTPEEFDRFIVDDVERMAKVIKAAGIKPQ